MSSLTIDWSETHPKLDEEDVVVYLEVFDGEEWNSVPDISAVFREPTKIAFFRHGDWKEKTTVEIVAEGFEDYKLPLPYGVSDAVIRPSFIEQPSEHYEGNK